MLRLACTSVQLRGDAVRAAGGDCGTLHCDGVFEPIASRRRPRGTAVTPAAKRRVVPARVTCVCACCIPCGRLYGARNLLGNLPVQSSGIL